MLIAKWHLLLGALGELLSFTRLGVEALSPKFSETAAGVSTV